MKLDNVGQFNNADDYVTDKVRRFSESDHTFATLFSFMFSERENVLYEDNNGYKINKITYGEVYDKILKLASGLKEELNDVPTHSIVAIAMNNGVEWIETFWAVLLCGYSPLLVNLRLDKKSVEDVYATANVKAVISDERRYAIKTVMFSDISSDCSPIDIGETGEEFFVMSSGTTFHVKLCAYSSEELYYQICDSAKIIKDCKQMKKHYEGQLKLLTFLPFYHIFGFVAVYVWFAFFSRTFVALKDFAPQTIVNTIRRHKVTHIFAVPMFWEKVYSEAVKTIKSKGDKVVKKFEKGLKIYNSIHSFKLRKAFSRMAFGEVRENLFGDSICFCITGGSHISKEAFTFFNAIGYHIANGYGMSEAGITSVELSENDRVCNTLSVGRPFSSAEYKISDKGELMVRGKSTSMYVLCNGERTDVKGNWYNTHDVAECIDGRYYILGRMDDIVIGMSGENLNPNLIEPLVRCEGVRDVCLIGGHKTGATVPVLIVSVSKYISAQKLNSVKEKVATILSRNGLDKQIGELVFVSDALMGEDDFKLNRTKISRMYDECAFTVVEPHEGEEEDDCNPELKRRIKEYFAVALNMRSSDIAYTADFFLDLGGNSLDYFAMISHIREEFDVSFPSDGNATMNTVKSICDFLKENS